MHRPLNSAIGRVDVGSLGQADDAHHVACITTAYEGCRTWSGDLESDSGARAGDACGRDVAKAPPGDTRRCPAPFEQLQECEARDAARPARPASK